MIDNISFVRNKYSKPKQLESFEVILEHNEQVPIEFEIPKLWQSIQERREPSWHSKFVLKTNVAYRLLIEHGEPLNYHKTINSSNSFL